MQKRSTLKQPVYAPADRATLDDDVQSIAALPINKLRELWQQKTDRHVPAALTKDLLARLLTHQLQEECLGSLTPRLRRLLGKIESPGEEPTRHLKVGSVIVREYQGMIHEVLIVPDGFCWQGKVHTSLSTIARKITGTSWNGPRFFGLRGAKHPDGDIDGSAASETDPPMIRNAAIATFAENRSRSIKAGRVAQP
jgi:hypothetical protein